LFLNNVVDFHNVSSTAFLLWLAISSNIPTIFVLSHFIPLSNIHLPTSRASALSTHSCISFSFTVLSLDGLSNPDNSNLGATLDSHFHAAFNHFQMIGNAHQATAQIAISLPVANLCSDCGIYIAVSTAPIVAHLATLDNSFQDLPTLLAI
jgi:hypothetical protein